MISHDVQLEKKHGAKQIKIQNEQQNELKIKMDTNQND
jgi:hypothetical protein